MPIYEYQCRSCQARFSLLIGMVSQPDEEKCPKCSSLDIQKRVSRFRRLKTEDERIDETADRLERMGEPESPAEMRQFVREMANATDDDLADDMEEMFEADMEEEAAGSGAGEE